MLLVYHKTVFLLAEITVTMRVLSITSTRDLVLTHVERISQLKQNEPINGEKCVFWSQTDYMQILTSPFPSHVIFEQMTILSCAPMRLSL